MFELVSESFKSAINKLRFVDDEKALKNALDTLKKALLKADVHHKVVKDLLLLIEEDVKKNGIGQKQFLEAIKTNLENILNADGKNQGFVFATKPPTVVLMVGLQGGGKTTSTVKLANYLKLRNKKVLIAACDLQRLAAVEQLKQLCEANELDLFYIENEKDPIKVAQQALEKAKNSMADVLLVDTAGRLAIDEALMNELKAVKNVLNPDEIFYVADAMSGQDGVKTASSFNELLGITGVILSKFDADTKGGIALGITKQIGIPLRFVGVGEKIADLEIFIPERIVNRIMGEGDLATLAEKTAAIIDEKEAKKLNQKIKKGEFNFNDFLTQMESVKKLGSMKSIIGMIPGLSNVASSVKDLDLDNSKEIIHIKAMISSMTPKERENPDLLNNARKRRIAEGAGLSQVEVNRFLK
ncbi:TPA: signal recognition particle protein, partial [Campylobacter coli]